MTKDRDRTTDVKAPTKYKTKEGTDVWMVEVIMGAIVDRKFFPTKEEAMKYYEIARKVKREEHR